MKDLLQKAKIPFQILSSIWIMYIFLGSLPYKFSGHEHTQYIFWTIGDWLWEILWNWIGNWFSNYAAYVIWSAELIVSLILLSGIVLSFIKKKSACSFAIGGVWASALMLWAVFFHLFTPLWIEVNGDGWSLFRAAVSILILGLVLAWINCKELKLCHCKK
jgi:hypothetical protein